MDSLGFASPLRRRQHHQHHQTPQGKSYDDNCVAESPVAVGALQDSMTPLLAKGTAGSATESQYITPAQGSREAARAVVASPTPNFLARRTSLSEGLMGNNSSGGRGSGLGLSARRGLMMQDRLEDEEEEDCNGGLGLGFRTVEDGVSVTNPAPILGRDLKFGTTEDASKKAMVALDDNGDEAMMDNDDEDGDNNDDEESGGDVAMMSTSECPASALVEGVCNSPMKSSTSVVVSGVGNASNGGTGGKRRRKIDGQQQDSDCITDSPSSRVLSPPPSSSSSSTGLHKGMRGSILNRIKNKSSGGGSGSNGITSNSNSSNGDYSGGSSLPGGNGGVMAMRTQEALQLQPLPLTGVGNDVIANTPPADLIMLEVVVRHTGDREGVKIPKSWTISELKQRLVLLNLFVNTETMVVRVRFVAGEVSDDKQIGSLAQEVCEDGEELVLEASRRGGGGSTTGSLAGAQGKERDIVKATHPVAMECSGSAGVVTAAGGW